MKIQSFGAAKTVTGSCHIVKESDVSVMIDCGLFQGKDEESKNSNLGFNPEEIDYLILTHAHLDHCGRIPMLIKGGFKGKIYCTKPTFQLARLIMLDTAKIMLEDYKHNLKRRLRYNPKKTTEENILNSNKSNSAHIKNETHQNNHHNTHNTNESGKNESNTNAELLYNEIDVFESLDHFNPILAYNTPFVIDEKHNIAVEIQDAGHILGSSFVKLTIGDKSAIFSGDLGNKNKPIVNNFSYPDEADAVYIETTYGDRMHKSFADSKVELLNIIQKTINGGGNVLIPSYAMERTQDILYVLKEFYKSGELPKCKIFLDSPLAINITDIFLRNPEYFRKDELQLFTNNNPFEIPYLTETRDIEESKEINKFSEGAIIIAGSGMLTGGRMLHHLKHNLWRKENSIIFIGYQARGTLGRRIVEGDKTIKVFGEHIDVNASVYTINGFSSHADQKELIEWLSALKNQSKTKIYLIHGDDDKMEIFKEKIKPLGFNAYIPSYAEEITVE
ncbi:MAG: MBL fold metallo-hydrolase [Candidatus Acididesulfobacter diazotrophicus]|uniref:MBL fold metallo-hydrolase n=1 Tax=Candidatus Acididesulfobacter diazotrophicus TaxID=2597226 RepID=A0A519BKX1_9DELT|nr:MAG: MBL fold metallo-hydrolase [Candidatus Acididesulfobacter diazotrophicus]